MGKLYVVPTPVGNLEDITFRAIKVLKEADLILAEDTRTSGILLKHFEIKNSMQSHHKFNEHKTLEGVINRIKGGETVALNFGCRNAWNIRSRISGCSRMCAQWYRGAMSAGSNSFCPSARGIRIAVR